MHGSVLHVSWMLFRFHTDGARGPLLNLLMPFKMVHVYILRINHRYQVPGKPTVLEDLGDDKIALGPYLEVKSCDRFRLKTSV